MVEGSRPRVLLLDEPTSGLDPVVRQELLAVLSEARLSDPGRIVVFSTHILEDVVQVATCVSLVRRGRVFSPAFVDQLQSWRRTDPEARPRMLAAIFGVESFG